MKIALVAATGKIGRQIARRALDRGHYVTAIVRRDNDLPTELAGASIVVTSLTDAGSLAEAIRGHDVLASAYGPIPGDYDSIISVADTLIIAARRANIRRLIVVGGAGSLEVSPGVQLVDTPNFPDAYKPYALAHRAALGRFQAASDLDWTFYAPAAEICPGEHRGVFRTQATTLLVGAQGHSAISYADYAEAFVREIEQPRFAKQIVTAAY